MACFRWFDLGCSTLRSNEESAGTNPAALDTGYFTPMCPKKNKILTIMDHSSPSAVRETGLRPTYCFHFPRPAPSRAPSSAEFGASRFHSADN
jgi:hypothetical protein